MKAFLLFYCIAWLIISISGILITGLILFAAWQLPEVSMIIEGGPTFLRVVTGVTLLVTINRFLQEYLGIL